MADVSRIQRLARRLGNVYNIDAEATVAEAVRKMEEKEVGCLMVSRNGHLEGICTERDVIRCLATLSRSPADVRVGEIMTRQIISCSMETSIAKAQLIMAAHGIRHLPVLENGKPVGMISSRDILANKLLEANKALARTTEEAEKARGAKDRMLSTVSHELRTPLNGILGMTELTLETDLTPQQREYLQVVRSSAEELDLSIRALLEFSKLEAGIQEIEHTRFSLGDLIRQTLTLLAHRAEIRGLDFQVEMGDLPETVVGDAGRLAQVMTNVIGNAIKFTSTGSVAVRIEVLNQSQDAVRIGFTVTDTGIGIDSEHLEAIFEAFRQADGGDTRAFGGTGLGLTISARLVQMMGGQITAESAPRKGSTFRFSVSLALPTANQASRPKWRTAQGKEVEQEHDAA